MLSIKDGELNVNTLPCLFINGLRPNKNMYNQGRFGILENHLVDLIFIFNYNINKYSKVD